MLGNLQMDLEEPGPSGEMSVAQFPQEGESSASEMEAV